MGKLYNYVVLLTEDCAEEDPPIAFTCMAESAEHAEEQVVDAYPGCVVDFVMATASVASAYMAFEGDGPDGT